MTPEIKAHIYSSVVTFLSVFLIFVGQALMDASLESLTWGAIGGIIIAAVRAGVRILFQSYVIDYEKR
jgi:membrane-bound ClpP family serine protease